MALNLEDKKFKKIFNSTKFYLPIRWDGKDFEQALSKLFEKYQKNVFTAMLKLEKDIKSKFVDEFLNEISKIKENILNSKTNYRYEDIYTNYNIGMRRCFATADEEMAHICKELVNECCLKLMRIYFGNINDDQKFNFKIILKKICKVALSCSIIKEAVSAYLRGFPSDAYDKIDILMTILISDPLGRYSKIDFTTLKLYRVVSVDENIVQPRKRIFHPPYNLRTKVSTNRYSIAGFPSLYLGSTVELCIEEMHSNPYEKYTICSRFSVKDDFYHREMNILELGIKPQDFLEKEKVESNLNMIKNNRKESLNWIFNDDVRGTYLLWYPLIAACSFIRAYRKDPFAPEYIIPQLLIQWLRKHNRSKNGFFGLRYFSCYSERSSDLGFNFIFPTSGDQHQNDKNYCSLLGEAFVLTKPVYLHNFKKYEECERVLEDDNDLKPFNE